MSKKRENSVRNLANLYTVVIGLALSLALEQMVKRPGGILSVSGAEILLFGAFIITLVPFFHGALRHLDDAYLENPNVHIRDGALIVDVALLMLHGIVFVVLALLLGNPGQFVWLLVALISVDVIWGAFVHFGASTPAPYGAEGKWALINVVCVAVAGAVLYGFDIGLKPTVDATKLSLAILVGAFIRTLTDYVLCWAFYFPPESG